MGGKAVTPEPIVIDLFNREVVGWSLKPRMTADIVTDALTMAWFRRKPAAGLIHHSDRGSQLYQPARQRNIRPLSQRYSQPAILSRLGMPPACTTLPSTTTPGVDITP